MIPVDRVNLLVLKDNNSIGVG